MSRHYLSITGFFVVFSVIACGGEQGDDLGDTDSLSSSDGDTLSDLDTDTDTDADTDSDTDTDTDTDTDADTETDSGDLSGTPLGINGQLYVNGTELRNAQDYPIQLRGMSTHGLQWYRHCISDDSLSVLASEWEADILRLSMYVQEDGYETNPDYFTQVVDGYVDDLKALGLYALVDWHQLDPGDPNYNLASAKVFFEHISKTHGAKGHVLYDICNEPNGVDWADIYAYAMEVIPVIRANDPDSVIIVGTPGWAHEPDAVIGNKLPFDNIMYSMHFYAADDTFEGGQWGSSADNVETAINAGIPVFVTEFGSQESDGDGPNDFYSTGQWLDYLRNNKISWINWNFSDDFRSGAVWKSGTCGGGDWTDSNLKESGLWIKERLSTPADDFGTP